MSHNNVSGGILDSPEAHERAILAARARALARRPEVQQASSLVSLVAFTIGGRELAVEAVHVRSVLSRPLLSPVPFAPPALVGLTNVRGEILVVADVSTLLGLTAPGTPGPVIVIQGQEPPIGLLVDAVHDVFEIPADTIVDLPSQRVTRAGSSQQLLRGFVRGTLVLSATSVLNDARLSTIEFRSRR